MNMLLHEKSVDGQTSTSQHLSLLSCTSTFNVAFQALFSALAAVDEEVPSTFEQIIPCRWIRHLLCYLFFLQIYLLPHVLLFNFQYTVFSLGKNSKANVV